MAKEGILNLLIAHENSDDANRLINLLEGASYQVRAHLIEPGQDVVSLLQNQHWDLAIGHLQSESIPAKKLMAAIRSQKLDIPAILISNKSDIVDVVEGIRMGAAYVIPMDEDQYFLLATTNTLEHLEHRRLQLEWKSRYSGAETRCETLMDSSKNAIAVVQDGTYIYANEPYSQLMGFDDPDDMVLATVIDTIDISSREDIKPFLRPLSADTVLNTKMINLTYSTPNGQLLDIRVGISQIEYQGETALQFLVKNEADINPPPVTPTVSKTERTAIETLEIEDLTEVEAIKELELEPLTEAGDPSPSRPTLEINPETTLGNIALAINSANQSGGEDSLILCIQADQDKQIRHDTSETNAEDILLELTDFILEKTTPPALFSRNDTNTFTLIITGMALEEGKKFAEILCQQVSENTFQVGLQSVVLSISTSIGLITRNTGSSEQCMEQCLKTLCDPEGDSIASTSSVRIYLVDALCQTDFTVNTEEKIALFGRQLLEKRLIGIAFQPIVALNDDSSEFYEVLMRPKIEEYPENIPEDFVAKVFASPIATEIDRWVILETIKKLGKKHSSAPRTCLFINLSATSIQDEKFSPWLKLALKTSNIPPRNIIFQLKENDAGRYIEQSKTLITQLKAIGSNVALTQFGLSSNPVLVLEKLPVDYVKLDQALINKVKAGGDALEETKQLIVLLKEKGQHCIAPFVENPTMIPTLWQSGVEYIQGHYVQAPSPNMEYDFNDED